MPPAEPRVLVVDDDPDVLGSLERGLRLSGFRTLTACDGGSALRAMAERPPDAVVLDLGLPDMDGVALVTALRAMGHEVPVCVLSARNTVSDRVGALEVGADDYLVKPFALEELVARVRALLRRRPPHAVDPALVVGPLRIDPARRAVRMDKAPVVLTKREYELLRVLAENATLVLSRVRLLELVWGYDFATDTNVVDVVVGHLRRKLEADGAARLIHTVRGVGFVLGVDP